MPYFIQSGDFADNLAKVVKSTNPAQMPSALADYVIPTINVNDGLLDAETQVVKNGAQNDAGSTTLYTTPTDRDFYLTSFTHMWTKTAVGASINSVITVVIRGVTTTISTHEIHSATAAYATAPYGVAYSRPIKLDRGTAITLTIAAGAGDSSAAACITGFEKGR